MEKAVKEYLEEKILEDDALCLKYKADMLEDMFAWIYEEVKKKVEEGQRHGNVCIAVEDAEVYKMARDYFIDGIGEKRKAEKEEEERKKKEKAAREEIYKKNKARFQKPQTYTSHVDDVGKDDDNDEEDVEETPKASVEKGPKVGEMYDLFGGM